MNLQYTQLDGYRIHSVHDGVGEPVVLLHGLSGSWRWWRYTVPALSRNYAVHVPDLAGFGRSRPAIVEFSINRVAELVRAWLVAQRLERVHLVGHSMGAQVAVHLASDHPELVRRLVLVSASGVPRKLSPGAAVRFLAELIPPRAWGAPMFIPHIARDAVRAGPRTLLRAARGLLIDDVLPRLGRIVAPTLVMWGELDPLTPLSDAATFASTIPNAKLIVLKGAAHNPMVDRAEDFNRELLAFLAN